MGVAAGHDVAATKTVTDLGCACCFEDGQPFEIPDPPKVTFVDHNPFPSNEDLAKDDIITSVGFKLVQMRILLYFNIRLKVSK